MRLAGTLYGLYDKDTRIVPEDVIALAGQYEEPGESELLPLQDHPRDEQR